MISFALIDPSGDVDCLYRCTADEAEAQHVPDGWVLIECPDEAVTPRRWQYLHGEFIAKPEPGVTISQIRSQRAALLADTDWTQLPDVPEATSSAWLDYRQALRDAPAAFEALGPDFEWPAPPTGE